MPGNESESRPRKLFLFCLLISLVFSTATITQRAPVFPRLSPSHLHEQYLEDFLNLKAERDRVFLGNGLVGGVYTEPVAIV